MREEEGWGYGEGGGGLIGGMCGLYRSFGFSDHRPCIVKFGRVV